MCKLCEKLEEKKSYYEYVKTMPKTPSISKDITWVINSFTNIRNKIKFNDIFSWDGRVYTVVATSSRYAIARTEADTKGEYYELQIPVDVSKWDKDTVIMARDKGFTMQRFAYNDNISESLMNKLCDKAPSLDEFEITNFI